MTTKKQRVAALDEAIGKVGIVAFAKSLPCTTQAVYAWKERGYVPLLRAAKIEALYGVPREKLVKPEEAAALLGPVTDGSELL